MNLLNRFKLQTADDSVRREVIVSRGCGLCGRLLVDCRPILVYDTKGTLCDAICGACAYVNVDFST